MSRTITLIRHAETEANAATRWQGRENAPFSAAGQDQVSRLAGRFSATRPDRLVASDLERTMRTAAAVGKPTPDARWREFDVGAWEGLTTVEVRERFPGQLEALVAGEDIAPGGGEQMSSFHARIRGALDDLADDLDDGDEAIVVTHGGVIWAVASYILGAEGYAPVIPSHNTAVTRIRIDDTGDKQLAVFNDAVHLDRLPTQFGPVGTIVSLYRHGQTEGNVAGRWQGRSDSPLTDHGRWQVATTAGYPATIDALFTSPLGRTADTAVVLAEPHALEPTPHDGLIEMSFGSWENMTLAEAAEADPDLFDAIYRRNEDHPRGRDGESFTQAGERMAVAVQELAADRHGSSIGVVSHGAIIRAYVAGFTGIGFANRNRIPIPRNSSVSRVIVTESGPVLAAYNVAPHLD